MVKMTKSGFVMLVMGFTGEAAMAFKEAYIAAFDAMAAYIVQHQTPLSQDAGAGRRGVCARAGRGSPGARRHIRGCGALGHVGKGGRDGVMRVRGDVEFHLFRVKGNRLAASSTSASDSLALSPWSTARATSPITSM